MGKGEGFSPPSFRLSPIVAPVVPLSLSRGRERASILFLRLFLIYRLFSFFLLTKSVLSAAAVPRREMRRARERKKLIDPFASPERNVELEVICCEGVGVGRFRQEGGATTGGGGALKGSCEGGFPTTSGR